jgi:hypothetical protein
MKVYSAIVLAALDANRRVCLLLNSWLGLEMFVRQDFVRAGVAHHFARYLECLIDREF